MVRFLMFVTFGREIFILLLSFTVRRPVTIPVRQNRRYKCFSAGVETSHDASCKRLITTVDGLHGSQPRAD
jgi:hypothetical protein